MVKKNWNRWQHVPMNVIVFVGLLFIIAIINLNTSKSTTFIENENRMAAEKPEFSMIDLKSGQYFSGFEAYFTDHFMFRQEWVTLSKQMEALEGIHSDSSPQLMTFAGANVTQKSTSIDSDTSENAKLDAENVGETQTFDNWGKLLVYGDTVMEINWLNEAADAHYAEAINAYAERFGDTCQIFSMLIPTQIEFIADKSYRDLSYSQRASINDMTQWLKPSVNFVDVYDTLKLHSDEYIYFRTDHHWTQLGALYAFEEFANALTGQPILLENLTPITVPDYLGSLYTATGLEALKAHPDDVLYFDGLPANTVTDETGNPLGSGEVYERLWLENPQKYGIFLGGDKAFIHIQTEGHTNRRLLVLKDSYGNAFIPLLTTIADDIIVIDPRLYEGDVDGLVSEYGITDILFLNYALVNRWDGYAGLYEDLLVPTVLN